MEVQYKTHKLDTEFSITDLVNVSYYTLSKDFLWSGESHEPWEMVYVDKGEMVITAGTDTYLLKSGEAERPLVQRSRRSYDMRYRRW